MWLVWHANVVTDSYLITFLSRQSVVSWLRASGRNWFRTVINTITRKKENKVFCIAFNNMLSCEMWPVRHAKESWELTGLTT